MLMYIVSEEYRSLLSRLDQSMIECDHVKDRWINYNFPRVTEGFHFYRFSSMFAQPLTLTSIFPLYKRLFSLKGQFLSS